MYQLDDFNRSGSAITFAHLDATTVLSQLSSKAASNGRSIRSNFNNVTSCIVTQVQAAHENAALPIKRENSNT
jgi:F0F1-type ATP synthase beta subunit